MRRGCLIILTSLMFILLGCKTKTTQSDIPDCVVSNTFNNEYSLIIIANQDKIENKEIFAKQLIEQVCNNDFKTILFSYDEIGYPTRLEMAVYLSQTDWKSNKEPYMNVVFKQDNITNGYNTVEHYDKFHLSIE